MVRFVQQNMDNLNEESTDEEKNVRITQFNVFIIKTGLYMFGTENTIKVKICLKDCNVVTQASYGKGK